MVKFKLTLLYVNFKTILPIFSLSYMYILISLSKMYDRSLLDSRQDSFYEAQSLLELYLYSLDFAMNYARHIIWIWFTLSVRKSEEKAHSARAEY